MAFTISEKMGGGGPRRENSVLLRRHGRPSGPSGVLDVSGDIITALGMKDRAVLLVGEGPDAGKFLIRLPQQGEKENTYKLAGQGAAARTFGFGIKKNGLKPLTEKSQIVPHEITPDGLLIDLRHLMADAA